MKVTGFVYNLNSPDPQRLARFYREVVGLQPNPNIGESAFQAGEGASFIIDGHSQVKGPSRSPPATSPTSSSMTSRRRPSGWRGRG